MTAPRFDPQAAAAALWRKARQAALASLSANGMPFNSWVGVAAESANGTIVMLLSDLAVHSANLKADSRASLLIVGGGADFGNNPAEGPAGAIEDPLTLPRLTLVGHASRAAEEDGAAALYLARHPGAAGYAGFADFRFYRFTPQAAHLVAGFGRIAAIDPAAFVGISRSATPRPGGPA